jgi:hypothetical protein
MNWSWIPQLHYDLIGRIVPGVAIVVASVFVAAGPKTAAHLFSNAAASYFGFGPIVLGILMAYLVGLVLTEIWERTLAVALKRHEDAKERRCYEECLDDHGRLSALEGRTLNLEADDLPRSYVLRTHLRHVVPGDVARLMKLRAERRFCQVLILGFGGLAIANLWLLISVPSISRIALELAFLFIGAVLWFRSERLLRHFITGTCIAWLVQRDLGTLPFANAGKPAGGGASNPNA